LPSLNPTHGLGFPSISLGPHSKSWLAFGFGLNDFSMKKFAQYSITSPLQVETL
jgi:hypothetical protein